MALDVTDTRSQVMAAGRSGNLIDQFRSWVMGFVEPRELDERYRLEDATLEAWLADLPDAKLRNPVEPSFSGASGSIVVEPGVDGLYLDAATVAAAAADAFTRQSSPFTVAVDWTPIPPRVTPQRLKRAVAAAERLADSHLTVSIGEHVTRLGQRTINRWIVSERRGGSLKPVFQPEVVQRSLERILAPFADEGEPPTFTIVDGAVAVELGIPPTRCCADGVSAIVFDAITAQTGDTVVLPLVETVDRETQAANVGIVELVAEFTTFHACCENRVENIHRIADLIRGVVIDPGESFSVNDYVGERTAAKGFVAAGTIQQGRFEDAIGGGISQFATTMFNASFFAGLDFVEYQSHSIYISRYPYGREATLSYPNPDLVVTNTTPYGMLIWPTYTDSSITIQLWSTEYWDVVQTGQSSYPIGQCTRVETYRSRVNPAGVAEQDVVYATYRPGEGLDCAGNPTPEIVIEIE
ncbi:MAG: VanW family protein [Acidimicrobiia bacterium]|nr:VanW family protein [Acidimicrobiia bacterium]